MTSIDFQFPLRQSTGPDVGMSFFSGRIHRWSCSDLCHKQVLLLRCTRSKMPPNKGDLEFDLEEIMQAREFAIQNRLNKPHACHSTGVRQALGHAWPRLAAGARRVPANAGSQNPAVKSWPRATGRTHNKPKHSNKGGHFLTWQLLEEDKPQGFTMTRGKGPRLKQSVMILGRRCMAQKGWDLSQLGLFHHST